MADDDTEEKIKKAIAAAEAARKKLEAEIAESKRLSEEAKKALGEKKK